MAKLYFAAFDYVSLMNSEIYELLYILLDELPTFEDFFIGKVKSYDSDPKKLQFIFRSPDWYHGFDNIYNEMLEAATDENVGYKSNYVKRLIPSEIEKLKFEIVNGYEEDTIGYAIAKDELDKCIKCCADPTFN